MTLERIPGVANEAATWSDSGGVTLLDVPHRNQFDNSYWARANCGPAALAMVLGAYGIERTPEQVRAATNEIEGEGGPTVGVSLDTLAAVARERDLDALGLSAGDGYARWSIAGIRREIALGRPVITLVHFAALPGNEQTGSTSDHFIVVVGTTPEGFLVNDPALPAETGLRRPLTEGELARAWAASGLPGQALAIGAGPSGLPVPVAYLSTDEWAASAATPVAAGTRPTESATTATSTPTMTARPTSTSLPSRTPAPDRWSHGDPPTIPATAGSTDDSRVLAETDSRPPRDALSIAILALGLLAGVLVLRPSRH